MNSGPTHRLLTAFALALLAACGSDGPTGTPPNLEVGRVEIGTDTVRLLPGQSHQLVVSLFSTTGKLLSGVGATWNSSDAAVVRVGTTGQVDALAPGSARITVSAGGKQANAQVAVGLTGRYALRRADGDPVPGIITTKPNCLPVPQGETHMPRYSVGSGLITFTPGSPEAVVANLSVTESCPFSLSIYYVFPLAGAYDVVDGMVRWRHERGTNYRVPFGDAQISGDTLILKWKPNSGDSIRFHFVKL